MTDTMTDSGVIVHTQETRYSLPIMEGVTLGRFIASDMDSLVDYIESRLAGEYGVNEETTIDQELVLYKVGEDEETGENDWVLFWEGLTFTCLDEDDLYDIVKSWLSYRATLN